MMDKMEKKLENDEQIGRISAHKTRNSKKNPKIHGKLRISMENVKIPSGMIVVNDCHSKTINLPGKLQNAHRKIQKLKNPRKTTRRITKVSGRQVNLHPAHRPRHLLQHIVAIVAAKHINRVLIRDDGVLIASFAHELVTLGHPLPLQNRVHRREVQHQRRLVRTIGRHDGLLRWLRCAARHYFDRVEHTFLVAHKMPPKSSAEYFGFLIIDSGAHATHPFALCYYSRH